MGGKIDLHVFLLCRVSSINETWDCNDSLKKKPYKHNLFTSCNFSFLVVTLFYLQFWNVSFQINSLPVTFTLHWKKGTTYDCIFNIGHILRRSSASTLQQTKTSILFLSLSHSLHSPVDFNVFGIKLKKYSFPLVSSFVSSKAIFFSCNCQSQNEECMKLICWWLW